MTIVARLLLPAAGVLCVLAGGAGAELKVEGTGLDRVIVREQFDETMRARYDVFEDKCTNCHRMARIVDALQRGVTPITESPFDERGIRRYVIKMMRKGKSGISKDEAAQIIDFLLLARRLALEPPPEEVKP